MPEPTTNSPVPFIGRETELNQLHEGLRSVLKNQQPKFLLIQGDFGVGKTALVEHFLARVADQNLSVLIGQAKCAMETERNGLIPFSQLLASLTEQGIQTGVVLGGMWEFTKEVAPAWLDIFTVGAASAVVKTVEEGNKLLGRSTFSQENVFIQFADALSRLAGKNLIIAFIDDLHWAGASSLELLFYLARYLKDRPVLFICTYRPVEAMETGTNALLFREVRANLLRYEAIELEIQQGIDVTQYVTQRYPHHFFPESFIEHVQKLTGGHALFVSQLFSLWQETGLITSTPTPDGQPVWGLRQNVQADPTLPQTLSEVLAERLRQMQDELRETLKLASVEGENFTAQVIMRLRQLDELQVYDNLDTLGHRYRMIQEQGTKELASIVLDFYRFTHRFFREHIYKQLEAGKQRTLHRQVGECLEALYSDRREVAGQLAEHFRLARQREKASQYSLLAAQVAQARYSLAEAISWTKTTLELLEQLPESEINLAYKAEAIIIWQDCANTTGEFEEFAPYFKTLIDVLSRKEGLKGLLVRVLVAWGWSIYWWGSYYNNTELGLETVARQAVSVAEELGDLMGVYDAKHLLSFTLMDELGKYKEGREVLTQQLEIAKKLGDINKQADSLASLSWCLGYLGYYDEAVANSVESLSLIEKHSNDPVVLGFSLRSLGLAFQGQGNYESAIQTQRKALAVYERLRDALQANWCRIDMSETLCVMGILDEAYALLKECVSFLEKTNDFSLAFGTYMNLAHLDLERDNLVAAEKNLERARKMLEGYNNKADKIELNTTVIKFYHEKKEYQRVQDYFEETLSLLPKVESDVPALILYDTYGTVLQAKGDFDQAEEWYQKSLALSEQLNARVWMATTYQHLGSLYQLQEEVHKARDFYQRALQIRQELQHHWIVDEIQQSLIPLARGQE